MPASRTELRKRRYHERVLSRRGKARRVWQGRGVFGGGRDGGRGYGFELNLKAYLGGEGGAGGGSLRSQVVYLVHDGTHTQICLPVKAKNV